MTQQHTDRPQWTPAAGWLLLGIGLWLVALAWIRPLTLPDEGRYAGVAWDMWRAGSHATPLLDGMPYFHKPPLFYWLTEFFFWLFGPSPWLARLPSWLAAWASIAALYFFVRKHRDAQIATMAAVVLSCMPLYYGASQFANLDMLVAGMISLCVLAGAETVLRAGKGEPYRWMSLAAAAFAGLAILAKGLIGFVLPGAILFLWIVLSRRWRGLGALLWPPALLVFAAVALPWMWLMEQRFPGFYDYYIVYQHFQRFAESGFNNAQPFWFYLPVLLGLALPWSLWGRGLLRKTFWMGPTRELRLLALIWLGIVFVFFSLPNSKLVGYILPCFPPLAFLLAEVIMIAWRAPGDARTPQLVRISVGVAASICLIAVGVAYYKVRGSAGPLAKVIRPQMQANDTFVSLNSYPFDLALYAQAPKPFWVVTDWLDPQVPLRDNWRKELYDAAKFAPALGQELLISADTLTTRLCAASEGSRYWVWGVPEDSTRYVVLKDLTPAVVHGPYAIWLLQVDTSFKQRVCVETPIAD